MPRHVDRTRTVLLAACGWVLLASPPMRELLESRMTLHMLVQLPLLALLGALLGHTWAHANDGHAAARARDLMQSFNGGGATGIAFASIVMVLWMLPRFLDLARFDASVDALKFVSVTAAGVALAWSWPRLPALARAVVHLEVIATFLRFGWAYLAAEERLCLAYAAGDQARAGELLIWIGAAYAAAVAWRPMFGPLRPLTARAEGTHA